MNRKQLLVIIMVLALISTCVFAYAQNADNTIEQVDDAQASDPYDVPESHSDDTIIPDLEYDLVPEPAPTSTPCCTPQTVNDVDDDVLILTPGLSATPAPDIGMAATHIPQHTLATAEPTTEPTAEPETEVDEYVSPYAYIARNTVLFADENRKEKLGVVHDDTVMLAREVALHANGALYRVYFDTERTEQTDSCETAYLYSASLEFLDKPQYEMYLNSRSMHYVDGNPVPEAKVIYESAIDDNATAQIPEAEEDVLPHVNAKDVNLRAKPTRESESIAVLAEGESVEAIGRVINDAGEEWYAVIYNGEYGFIRADFVDGVGDIEDITYLEGEPTAEPSNEPTAEPSNEPTAEPTIDPSIEDIGRPDDSDRSIVVTAECDTEELMIGSNITLSATLEGYEGLDYTCVWQYADADKEGNIIGEWQDAQRGEPTFTYVLTRQNILTAWRMCVVVSE
jgi:hypothetical protein